MSSGIVKVRYITGIVTVCNMLPGVLTGGLATAMYVTCIVTARYVTGIVTA